MTLFYKWVPARYAATQTLEVDSASMRFNAKGQTREIAFHSVSSAYWREMKSYGLRTFTIIDKSGFELPISNGWGAARQPEGASFDEVVDAILTGLANTQPAFEVVLGYSPRMKLNTLLQGLPLVAITAVIYWFTQRDQNLLVTLSLLAAAAVIYLFVVVHQSGGFSPKKTTARQLADALSKSR